VDIVNFRARANFDEFVDFRDGPAAQNRHPKRDSDPSGARRGSRITRSPPRADITGAYNAHMCAAGAGAKLAARGVTVPDAQLA
jgi:hypothetical protein